MEEVVSYAALFSVFACVKIETKTPAYETTEEAQCL